MYFRGECFGQSTSLYRVDKNLDTRSRFYLYLFLLLFWGLHNKILIKICDDYYKNGFYTNDKQFNVIRVDIGTSSAFDKFDKIKNKNREVQVLEILNDKKLNIIREYGTEQIYP